MKFKKPSGVIVEVNENSAAYAESIGWKRVKPAVKKKVAKKKAAKKD